MRQFIWHKFALCVPSVCTLYTLTLLCYLAIYSFEFVYSVFHDMY